jgi:hypothetical protein
MWISVMATSPRLRAHQNIHDMDRQVVRLIAACNMSQTYLRAEVRRAEERSRGICVRERDMRDMRERQGYAGYA